MPHFVLPHGQLGPLIDIFVGVSGPRLAYLNQAGLPIPNPLTVKGLIDTGASHTAIDPSIVTALGLTPHRRASAITPSTGATPHSFFTYDVALYVPFPNSMVPWAKPVIEVGGLSLKHQGFDALIGRDLLAEGMLVYDGKHNYFTLAF